MPTWLTGGLRPVGDARAGPPPFIHFQKYGSALSWKTDGGRRQEAKTTITQSRRGVSVLLLFVGGIHVSTIAQMPKKRYSYYIKKGKYHHMSVIQRGIIKKETCMKMQQLWSCCCSQTSRAQVAVTVCVRRVQEAHTPVRRDFIEMSCLLEMKLHCPPPTADRGVVASKGYRG